MYLIVAALPFVGRTARSRGILILQGIAQPFQCHRGPQMYAGVLEGARSLIRVRRRKLSITTTQQGHQVAC